MKKPRFVNPFEMPGRWYRANFHTHCRSSDGALWLDDVCREYRKRGYRVLAITDHERTNDIRGLSDKRFLLISGMEAHPPFKDRPGNYHICTVGLPRGYLMDRASQKDVQACLSQVRRVGGVSILAHPRELEMTMDDVTGLKHMQAMEVWTTLSEVDGDMGNSERYWSDAMKRGLFMAAVGSDDTHWAPRHAWRDAFGGWTMLKMKSPSLSNVMEALRTGSCYASSGPVIKDFRLTGKREATLSCSRAMRIEFKYTIDERVRNMARPGKTVNSFTRGIPKHWRWVRAVVTDDCGRKAWTNPLAV